MKFFDGMTEEQIQKLEAKAMDRWDPFIMVKEFNKVIDRVRIDEYLKASESDKKVIKGSNYLLVKNTENIDKPEDKEHLDRLLTLNETIVKVMILKDTLKLIWECTGREEARWQISEWCVMAHKTQIIRVSR